MLLRLFVLGLRRKTKKNRIKETGYRIYQNALKDFDQDRHDQCVKWIFYENRIESGGSRKSFS